MTADSPTLTEHEQRIAEAIAGRTRPVSQGESLIAQVAAIFDISVEQIKGPNRNVRLVDARSVIAYILRERGWLQHEIGGLLNRNHATVGNLEKRIANDFDLKRLAKELVA